MGSPTDPFVVLALLSVAVGVLAAAVAWRQRDARGARAYTVLLLVLSTWSALYAIELLQPTVAGKRPWLVLRHALIPAVPIAFWAFVARFLDRPDLLERRVLAPIVAAGLLLAPMPVLDPMGLYFRSIELAHVGALPVLDLQLGPLFWCLLGYTVLVVGTGHSLVVGLLVDSFSVYRRQLTAVAVSGVVGFALLALFLTEHVPGVPTLSPAPNVQLLSYATALVVIPLGWSYYRDALFALQPLAHRTVVGNMDDAVFVLDTDGVVRKTNEPARRLLGRPEREALHGTTVETAFADYPDIVDAYERAVDPDAATTGVTIETAAGAPAETVAEPMAETPTEGTTETAVEAVEFTVDDRSRYVDLRASRIHDATGATTGIVIVARDVTERARQRERLERKNEQLERLADVIAHDMQGPLSTADSITALLERDLADVDDPQVEETLTHLETVHDSLREFADHLPRLARESVDVDSPVDRRLDDLAADAWAVVETEDVELRVDGDRTLAGDPRRLQQLFENLFRNAAEHGATPTDRPAERVQDAAVEHVSGDAAADASSADQSLRDAVTEVRVGAFDGGFYVEDDGPGIPPRVRDRVFEYGTTTGGGSGFGLAIVRTIVEAHGWSIAVAESDDGGARFEIRTDRTQ